MSAKSDLDAGLMPEELIPGDIPGIEAASRNASGFANQLASTVRGLKYLQINGSEWHGEAYVAYSYAHDMHLSHLQDATTAFDNVSTALHTYAGALRTARGTAATARHKHIEAKRAQLSNPNTIDDYLLHPSKIPKLTTIKGSQIIPADPMSDAVTMLEGARQDVDAAASDLAAALNGAAKLAPKPHKNSVGDNLKDTWKGLTKPVITIGGAPFKLVLDTDDWLSGHGNGSDVGTDLRNSLPLALLALSGGRGGATDDSILTDTSTVKGEPGGLPESALRDPSALTEAELADLAAGATPGAGSITPTNYSIVGVTQRLKSYVDEASAKYDAGELRLSPRQRETLIDHPNLKDAYRGSKIDQWVKDQVRRDPELNEILHVTKNGEAGPDFHDVGTNTWWDITTPDAWTRHLRSYNEPFGSGIGLFTK